MKEDQKQVAFRAWIAKIDHEFRSKFSDTVLQSLESQFADEFRSKFFGDFLELAELQFDEDFVVGKFPRIPLGMLAAGIAWTHRLMLRDARIGCELWVGSQKLGYMPLDHRTELEILQDHLPHGFRAEAFSLNLTIYAPSIIAAQQLWRDIGSIALRRLIGYWATLSILHDGYSIVKDESIVLLLKRFGQA